MTTITRFTKERLIAKLQHRIAVAAKYPEVEEAKLDAAIFKIALASLEAEPVADVVAWSSPNEERTCDIRWRRHDVEPGPLYVTPPAPVVPPAQNWEELCRQYPDMSIGDAIIRAAGWNLCRHAMLQGKAEPVSNREELPEKVHELVSAVRSINRAKHHIAKGVDDDEPCYWQRKEWIDWVLSLCDEVEQAGNSPVIPDGWIACSERMPEDEQEVLTINRMGHRFVSLFDEHSGLFFDRIDVVAACCIEHILVTHWMPLPAAPQQEVKRSCNDAGIAGGG